MKLLALLPKLKSWIQEEICAQERLRAELSVQEQAVRAGDLARFGTAGTALERELEAGVARGRRRDALIAACAAALGLQPRALTLGSLAEHARLAGAGDAGLEGLREELRRSTAEVLKIGRRVAALAKVHRTLSAEALQILLGGLERAGGNAEGRLVDARG